MKFQTEHLATLAKYAGISFVAGAVNHGFFSEKRSFVTAGVGVLCFVIGAAMEMKSSPTGAKRWADLLGFGILASIGLGLFTGGLQHFPDSPGRSAWVVPLGFFMSLAALYFGEGRGRISLRPFTVYGVVTGVCVIAGSLVAASYWNKQGGFGHDHSAHDHGVSSTVAAPSPAVAPADQRIRNVVFEVDDNRRITPANWRAQQGETVRLIVVNTGQIKHELVLGPVNDVAAHAESMSQPNAGHHGHDNTLSVGPGQTATLVHTFSDAGEWAMACLEPGHYEGGMSAAVEVEPKA